MTTDGASGSGCAPGTDALPTGIWFGAVIDFTTSSIEFDLACFYIGDAAWDKAAEHGEEAPNDFWIENENEKLRELDVTPGATVWTIPPDITPLQPLFFADWSPAISDYTPCPGEFCTVWIVVDDGTVTEIVEQYLP